jgi:hypothetical protein
MTYSRGSLSLMLLSALVVITIAADRRSASARPPHPPRSFVTEAVACRPTDAVAEDYRLYATGVITGSDSVSGVLRAAWNVPQVDSSQITFVLDSATCDQGARAHAIAAAQDTLNPPPVHVLRVGPTRYIAFNLAKAGEYLVYFVFDSTFHFLKAI